MEFSVLMSVYLGEKPRYLQKALQSIWDDQTCKPSQIILVKDGPLTPELDDIVLIWRHRLGKLLKIVSLPDNKGLGAALNEGLKYCDHELVARMDADDISFPSRFEKQIMLFSSGLDVHIVGAFAREINEKDQNGKIRKVPTSHRKIVSNLFACPIIHPSVVFKKSAIMSIGGYNKKLKRRQDYELWFRCANAGFKFYNIKEELIYYRFSDSSHARQPLNLALQQAFIGYSGVRKLGQPYWKALSCFVPFVRSLLPLKLQGAFYRILSVFDPRKNCE